MVTVKTPALEQSVTSRTLLGLKFGLVRVHADDGGC
jgi:hypothetical protein